MGLLYSTHSLISPLREENCVHAFAHVKTIMNQGNPPPAAMFIIVILVVHATNIRFSFPKRFFYLFPELRIADS